MIRPEMRNFYDTDENINQSLIILNAFTEKFSNNTYTLQAKIDNFCQRYKESIINNQLVASEDNAQILQTVDNVFIPFERSLDPINKNIRQCSTEMTQRAPAISSLLHTFEYLQKERTHIKNKNIMLQSSEIYERDIINIKAQINETLQNYTTEIKLYNDRIDVLQEMITYLYQTDNSSPNSTSNQFILSWKTILNNFDNLITFIENDSELVNNMRHSLFDFVSSIQNVKLIKLRELKDIESQIEESSALIENLQKQVSDLSTKNLDLTNTVETFRKELDEIQPLGVINAQLKSEINQLIKQMTNLKTKNKELQTNEGEYVKQYNDYKEKMEQERLTFETKIHDLENENETTILNLNSGHRKKLTSLAREKEKLANEIDQLKKLHDDDNEVNTKLQEQNNEQIKTIKNLRLQLDNLKQQSKNDLAKREEELLNREQALKNELSMMKSQVEQEQTKTENLKVDVQKLDQTNKIQRVEITSMTEELIRKNLHISELENKLKTLDQQILVLNTEKQNWNQREVELEQKYKAEKSEIELLKTRIENLIHAGASTEVLSITDSDENQSSTHLKRKLRSDENLTKRTKLHNTTFWKQQITNLNFTDTHVTVTINDINEKTWNPLRTKIKESSQELNRLHDKLAAVLQKFKTTQKLRNRNEKKIDPDEINNIIDEIREHLKIEEQYKNQLTDILLQINKNYKKDVESHENSQLMFINLISSIRTDYNEKVNVYNQKLSRLTTNQKTAKTESDLKKITENLEKINHQLERNKDITNNQLKDLQNQIIQFIEGFNERNEKRRKLLFSVQCHIVSNIYSKVKNELLISIDKLIY